ncbi:hypothetical protein PsYK624_000880 [Phanerochaete sordida]|uniref:Uncharacterized protein n=1 Tax=Phanerochaete sordida TaxID=48140 RepID=A0A9P3FX93_9APHY|nr:hypothetical protein PsYK624_000880 [Phanerochaete sordida]
MRVGHVARLARRAVRDLVDAYLLGDLLFDLTSTCSDIGEATEFWDRNHTDLKLGTEGLKVREQHKCSVILRDIDRPPEIAGASGDSEPLFGSADAALQRERTAAEAVASTHRLYNHPNCVVR